MILRNNQCVKDFPAVLLALYKRGSGRFRRQNEWQYRSPRPFCSASILEGRVALSVGHPRGTHSRYVIGCCLIPLGICGFKNNLRRITYGIVCV